MYYETTMHQRRPVASADEAAKLIHEGQVRDFDALVWQSPDGREICAVGDNHCNNTWGETAVIERPLDLRVHRRSNLALAHDSFSKRGSYGRQAQGKSINVMNIVALYREAREAILAGKSVDEAVADGIAKYCSDV